MRLDTSDKKATVAFQTHWLIMRQSFHAKYSMVKMDMLIVISAKPTAIGTDIMLCVCCVLCVCVFVCVHAGVNLAINVKCCQEVQQRHYISIVSDRPITLEHLSK